MDPHERIAEINLALQRRLGSPRPAGIAVAHKADALMVWFLFGGKDVGKSTFLNALLGTEVSEIDSESAAGTERFVAYVHRRALQDLQARLGDLPIEVRHHLHDSGPHERLCLIDGPDFDSRFSRHASQVLEVLRSGCADGAVLLASPEKYKNREYWRVFGRLAAGLSPSHILFTMTKADELGEYLEEVREDFRRTLALRMRETGLDPVDGIATSDDRNVFLIDSPNRAGDFQRLEARLLRKLSSSDVRTAQRENLLHALHTGVRRIRDHYELDALQRSLHAALAAERIDAICEEHFPDLYFQAVTTRLAADRGVAGAVREKLWQNAGASLAGLSSLLGALQWMASWNPFRERSRDGAVPPETEGVPLRSLTRWGQEDLDARIAQARTRVLSTLPNETVTREVADTAEAASEKVYRDLAQVVGDLLLQPADGLLSRPVRLLINLPVHLYFLLFLLLLLSPLLPLLRTAGATSLPDVAAVLTPDRIHVAILGFAGYYVMALLHVLRRQRERVREETRLLARAFVAEMRPILRDAVARPLEALAADVDEMQEALDRVTESA